MQVQAAIDISLLQSYVSIADTSFSTESLFRALYIINILVIILIIENLVVLS